MNNGKYYKGIDFFRLFAAILVVAIHTSPLASYNETADFILTRILARVAVPFFFMTSGFFLYSGYGSHTEKLIQLLKRTTLFYGLAIVIYIPLNIYNGYFFTNNLLPELLKDLIFDGTLYHLWYFPATILGAAISWVLIRKFGYKPAFWLSILLYMIGLLGDSYYGIAEHLPLLKGFYSQIFQVFDYTRNGIFFAPVCFILGGRIAKKTKQISPVKYIVPSIISFSLLLLEGLLLHRMDLQRHDSMYLLLLPCMYYLFSWLIQFNGKQSVPLRTLSLSIYIIHPMVIVAVRMFGKATGLQRYFIDNSLIHFFAVLILSVMAALLFLIVQFVQAYFKRYKPTSLPVAAMDRAWLEIDLNHLKHNARTLRKAMPKGCRLMAVVKADAYGHGATIVSECLNDIGVKAFAVATLDEGIDLRKYGIKGTILIMGYSHPYRAKDIYKYRLTQTAVDYTHAKQLNEASYHIKIHIKMDTGMHRLGIDADNLEQIESIFNMKYLKVRGIYTHLCVSESHEADDIHFTQQQITTCKDVLYQLTQRGILLPKVHVQSSYGLLNYPELTCDYVRAGISLYGTRSSVYDKTNLQLDLRPVLSLKSRVALIRTLAKNESVGYGRAFLTDKEMRIAVLPVGYADGIPRTLSCGNGNVLIHGTYAPIIGRVCMDQLMVDITGIPTVTTGDIATLIGEDLESSIPIAEVSVQAGSISNELLSRMGGRLQRLYKT